MEIFKIGDEPSQITSVANKRFLWPSLLAGEKASGKDHLIVFKTRIMLAATENSPNPYRYLAKMGFWWVDKCHNGSQRRKKTGPYCLGFEISIGAPVSK